jgi:hypothetical protein
VVDVEHCPGDRICRAVMGFNVHLQKSFQREDSSGWLLCRIYGSRCVNLVTTKYLMGYHPPFDSGLRKFFPGLW